MRIYPLTIE